MKNTKFAGGSTVNNHHRVKTLVYCVALALSQWGLSGQAVADSAVGQNTTLGNALTPAPINPTAKQADGLDSEGMGTREPAARSPSGLMYNIPNADPEPAEGKAPHFNASVEAGFLSVVGDKNAALYKIYRDPKTGPVLESFSLQNEKPESANFVEAVGGGLGQADQFYGVQFGKYNEWKVKAFYNETTHTFTSTAKPLWNGIGTDHLTLPASIPAGGGVVYVGTNVSLNQFCTGAIGTLCYKSTVYSSTNNATASNNFTAGTPVAAAALTNATANNLTDGGINVQATRAAIAAQNAMAYSELGLIRKNGGVSLDMNLTDTWKMFATATAEKRQGARPFGMVQNGGGGANNVEIAESIDYLTTDFKAGFRYADDLTQFNITASASLFHNKISALTVDVPVSPGITQTGALITQGRFALAPSNQAYDILGEFSRALPNFYNGQFTAAVSLGTSRQNEDLLPPTITTGTGTASAAAGAFNGNFSQWNTTAALSQKTSNARIDNSLVDLKLTLHPVNDLSVAAKLRYQETDNKTSYLACNPNATYANGTQYSAYGCTGVWGRLLNDGGAAAFVNTGAVASGAVPLTGVSAGALPAMTGVGPIRSIPWDNKTLVFGLNGDYRLNRASSFNAAYERETTDRTNREVDTTWEDKLKLGYTNRGIQDATVRLSVEHDHKRGSGYSSFPYVAFTGAAFFNAASIPANTDLAGAYVARLANIHKLDVADRDQNVINGRLNYAVRQDMDVGVSYQWKDATYPTNDVAGRQTNKTQSLNFDLSYQPSAERVFYGYYSFQDGRMKQNNVQNGVVVACANGMLVAGQTVTPDTAAAICGNVANSITFNPWKAYDVESHDTNSVFGAGFKLKLAKNTLDVNFTRSESRTKFGYNYVDPAAATAAGQVGAVTAAVAGVAGYAMPDMTYVTNVLSGNLLVPIDKNLSVRLLASYEDGKIKDWHYPSNLNSNLILGTGASFQLDAGAQDYRVTTVGVLLQYKM